jgi:hypothetical protein
VAITKSGVHVTMRNSCKYYGQKKNVDKGSRFVPCKNLEVVPVKYNLFVLIASQFEFSAACLKKY